MKIKETNKHFSDFFRKSSQFFTSNERIFLCSFSCLVLQWRQGYNSIQCRHIKTQTCLQFHILISKTENFSVREVKNKNALAIILCSVNFWLTSRRCFSIASGRVIADTNLTLHFRKYFTFHSFRPRKAILSHQTRAASSGLFTNRSARRNLKF